MLHVPAIFDAARMDIYTNYFYMFGLLFIAILYWIPIVTDICFERKQKLLYVGLSIFALIPVSLFLMFSTEGMYETYSDLGVFVDALEACFPPDEEPLPASFYESLLPSKPVQLQHVGGQILLGGGIVVFLITMLLVQVFEKRKATKKIRRIETHCCYSGSFYFEKNDLSHSYFIKAMTLDSVCMVFYLLYYN